MAICQRSFGQKNGKGTKILSNDAVIKDTPIIENVETGGIQWINERHVACVFLLDTSGSMNQNDAIGKLNAGLRTFKEQIINDSTYAAVAQRLKRMEDAAKVLGYCVGVKNFDRQTIARIFDPERIFELENLNFHGFFKFVSSVLATVRNSDPNGSGPVSFETPSDLHSINISF